MEEADSQTSLLGAPSARQAAIARIEEIQKALHDRYGLSVTMGAELEFLALDNTGKPQPNLIDPQQFAAALNPDYFERGYMDGTSGCQYEAVSRPMDPLVTAETMAAVKEGLAQNAASWGLGSVSFLAGKRGELIENNGYHLSHSLTDAAGNNLYDAKNGKGLSDLAMHVSDALLQVQSLGLLSYAPQETSYHRFTSNTGWILPKIAQLFKFGAKKATSLFLGLYATGSSPTRIYNMPNKNLLRGKSLLETLLLPPTIMMKFYTGFGGASGGSMATRYDRRNPHLTRIENRLAGADVDPYVIAAMDMSALYKAVQDHVKRDMNGALKVDPYTLPKSNAGRSFWQVGKELITRLHKDEGHIDVAYLVHGPLRLPLAKSHGAAVARFQNSQWLRSVIGTSLHDAVLASYGDPRVLPPQNAAYSSVGRGIIAYIKNQTAAAPGAPSSTPPQKRGMALTS